MIKQINMTGTQVIPSQVEENLLLPEIFLSSLADDNENHSKEKLIIYLKIQVLFRTDLIDSWQSHTLSQDLKFTLTQQGNLKELEEEVKDFNEKLQTFFRARRT